METAQRICRSLDCFAILDVPINATSWRIKRAYYLSYNKLIALPKSDLRERSLISIFPLFISHSIDLLFLFFSFFTLKLIYHLFSFKPGHKYFTAQMPFPYFVM